jgi:transposase
MLHTGNTGGTGIGPIIATAIATTVTDPNAFRSGREFAAWLGLVPRQNSTGGKIRLGGITKRGNLICAGF